MNIAICEVLSLYYILFRATALAILSLKNGLEALETSPTPQQLLPTPLQLLIKEMPGKNLLSFPY